MPSTKPENLSLKDKQQRLLDVLESYGRVAVAFSAGVDSTVVAKAAALACGDSAIAVTADSPSVARGEVEQARDLAAAIGIHHRVIRTEEFLSDDYLQNPTNRCYFCKTELYSQMDLLLPELDVDVIANGTNLDDLGDHRPGLIAADEHSVRSPLVEAGLRKADVRELARAWDLPVWDKPATPCLSSRIAYGIPVTRERVERIDSAERFLKTEFGLRELRVRCEANELARIEVPVDCIPQLTERTAIRAIDEKLRGLGFRCVTIDLRGFRSGSMNEVIPIESLTRFQ